jgi:hypothetical protein
LSIVAGLIATGESASADQTAGRITRTDFAAPSPLASIGEAYSRSSFFPYTFGPPLPPGADDHRKRRSVQLAVIARSATPDPTSAGRGRSRGGRVHRPEPERHAVLDRYAGAAGPRRLQADRFDTRQPPNAVNRRMLDQ